MYLFVAFKKVGAGLRASWYTAKSEMSQEICWNPASIIFIEVPSIRWGPGEDLLKMFDATYDELVQMKAIDSDYANEQKAALRKNIQEMG